MNDYHKPIHRESGVHGARWGAMHGGYFSSPTVAAPLIDAVERAMPADTAHTLADLGGGTGFLLSHFPSNRRGWPLTRINVDLSEHQLADSIAHGITCLHASAQTVTRDRLTRADVGLTLMMRSMLHYAGAHGAGELLAHLRAQLRPGEAFVHQTACFDTPHDAACLNQLYELMQSGKHYLTVDELSAQLDVTGWRVDAIAPAPPLPLTVDDLAERYNLSREDLNTIRTELTSQFGPTPGVFEPTADAFSAYLHYCIFMCRAV